MNVANVNRIVVNESDASDTTRAQVERHGTAESAAADDECTFGF